VSSASPDSAAREVQFADRLERVLRRGFRPVDVASLIAFRISFGVITCWWALDYVIRGRLQIAYIDPRFHFTYYGFDWVHPLPDTGMYLLFLGLAASGVAIATGFLYRWATLLFALGFTYVFLLDRTNYQNHYYLIVLISWLLVLQPLNCNFSLDASLGLKKQSLTLPIWMLWLTRFHIALPYVFGGIAKLEVDWFAGAPLRQILAARSGWPVIGTWLVDENVVQAFIWGGLLLDLLVVPALIWRRTRVLAFLACVVFHVLNSQLFSIHIFPWFMIAATTLFFEPEWPRRFLRRTQAPGSLHAAVAVPQKLSFRMRVFGLLLATYCLFHCVWPLRHHLYPGPTSWTERGHFFAWRMMLRGKTVGIRYYLTDTVTGKTQIVDPRFVLSPLQVSIFARDPEMILHLAHFFRDEYRRQFGHEARVRALVLTSLNGRKPQLQIDPSVDLAKEPRGFHRRPWIVPLTEPLPEVPWNVPMGEWERHVNISPLLERTQPSDL